MKDAFYFSHDSNARRDPDIMAMRSIYGTEGYGWYWIIVEILREQNGYKLELNKYTYPVLAMEMQCDPKTAEKFISDCIQEFNLFKSDGEFFWSESLFRRMAKMAEKSKKARKAAHARWNKEASTPGVSDDNASAMQTHSASNAIKEKEIKEKEIDSQLVSIAHVWENAFGPIPPVTYQRMSAWKDDQGMDSQLIIHAIRLTQEAITTKKVRGPTHQYCEGIIRDWHSKGICTLADLESYQTTAKGGQAHVYGNVRNRICGSNNKTDIPDIDWSKFDAS